MQLFNLGLQKSRFCNTGTVLEANLRPASTGPQIRLPDAGMAFEAEVTVRHTSNSTGDCLPKQRTDKIILADSSNTWRQVRKYSQVRNLSAETVDGQNPA